MRRLWAGVFLAVSVVLSGCARQYSQIDFASTASSQPYTVASGDRLRVIVFGQDSLSNSYSVDASGFISVPLIGLVKVGGMTTPQIQRTLETRFRDGFLRDPKVSCEIEAYRPFFILGEVTTAGQYPYVNGMTVQTAVAIAGGFTPRAQQSTVTLTRTINEEPVTGEVEFSLLVRPGDIIQVQERFF